MTAPRPTNEPTNQPRKPNLLAFQIRTRCHYCSKFRHQREVVRIGTGGAVMCWACYEHHQEALLSLCHGKPPKACHGCGRSYEELEKTSADGNVSMWCHMKDGIYQMLCRPCSDAYERKRLDLYGDTEYGWKKKLKGAK